jgi:hypothetical protein
MLEHTPVRDRLLLSASLLGALPSNIFDRETPERVLDVSKETARFFRGGRLVFKPVEIV